MTDKKCTERDALTATNNELVDTIRELRTEREQAYIECSKAVSERNSYGIHAATLAGALDGLVAYGEMMRDLIKPTSDLYICHIPRAAAALAAWRKAQGDGAKEVDHQARHKELHEHLDELLADFITHTKGMPSKNTILDLMRWSHEQTIAPSEIEGSDDNAKR